MQDSFDTQTVYVWDKQNMMGFAISVFRAGPFRIGYAGFPVGGGLNGFDFTCETIEALQHCKQSLKIDLLKIPSSNFHSNTDLPLPSEKTYESAIEGLEDWKLSQISSSLKRNIKDARRMGVQIIDASTPTHGLAIYDLYHKTLQRHGGSLRYSKLYFQNLVQLSCKQDNIRCLLATVNQDIIGFLCLVLSENIAYYLHAGMDTDWSKHRPSQLLIHDAITWSQQESYKTFNFMSSPYNQYQLVKYKERWGSSTKYHLTYTLSLNKVKGSLFNISRYSYDFISRYIIR
ncbi:MAG: hypothetical protein ETSY1_05295 [Candidatus Entotheonella factor]|uniref:BioF2-like acetyltransferase domain-containing protein n=1 Tax=Entotheonella factor TaxID=1429438 RepID=W4LX61_ENTF1|nr:MAG: hypothetical protein ETSY1_05295 [Candidatus Entotheonella factor]